MLNFGNKEFRNLQEQVLFNANELEALKQLQLGGVKIINLIEHSEDLPVEATAGDAYLVGNARPYRLYVYIDGDYFDLGGFPQEGPRGIQGIQGIKGETGQRGNKWSVGTVKPAGIPGDLHIDFNGNIYRFSGNEWQLFTSIRGPQGLQGPIGQQGPRGLQGIQGEKGDTGKTAPAVIIKGVLANISQLPSPTTVDRNSAYIIDKEIYVLTGESVLLWTAAGLISDYEISAGQVTFDDQYNGSLQASNVQEAIEQLDDLKVAKTTTINGKPLSYNIRLNTDDIDYDPGQERLTDALNYIETQVALRVPKSTTINNKPLSGNVTLDGTDIMVGVDSVANRIQDMGLAIQDLDVTKADTTYVDDKLKFKADNDLLVVENLVVNGDFSDGLTSFSPIIIARDGLTINNGKLRATALRNDPNLGFFAVIGNLLAGNEYYLSITDFTTNTSYPGSLEMRINAQNGNPLYSTTNKSIIFKPTYDGGNPMLVYFYNPISGTWLINEYFEIKSFNIFNISEMKLNRVKADSGIALASLTDEQIRTQLDLWVQSGLIDSKLEVPTTKAGEWELIDVVIMEGSEEEIERYYDDLPHTEQLRLEAYRFDDIFTPEGVSISLSFSEAKEATINVGDEFFELQLTANVETGVDATLSLYIGTAAGLEERATPYFYAYRISGGWYIYKLYRKVK